MSISRSVPVLLLLGALAAASATAQGVRLPEVAEHTLDNGIKVLMVERPGTGAVHAAVFVRGGRADTDGLPPAAADLLTGTLFRRLVPAALEPRLVPVLEQEQGAFEALRLDRLRQARLGPAALPSPDRSSLQAREEEAMAALGRNLAAPEAWDGLDALGGTGRGLEVQADFLAYGLDMPAGALPAWLRLETDRIRRLPLERYPLERDRLLQEIDDGTPPSPPSLSVLLGMALSGQRYALAGEFRRPQVESMTLKALQSFARRLVVPENLTVVLVGDLDHLQTLPLVQRTLGTLPRGGGPGLRSAEPVLESQDAPSALESPGGRRLLVSTTGDSRVLFGWRVPAANHPDGSALRTLAQVLGGAPSSPLNRSLVEARGVARRLTLTLGVPGRRDVNLLVIEAEPGPGHSLDELEQAIQDEVLRLQREPLSEQEVRQAQIQLESRESLVQEDAGTLAEALGGSQCQGGDWRLAFRALEANGNLKAADLQRVARTYLVPSRQTVALLGPDPLLQPLDRNESRLLQVLTVLLRPKLGDSAQAQGVLREALRQMRMLSPDERAQTLRLLESQVQK